MKTKIMNISLLVLLIHTGASAQTFKEIAGLQNPESIVAHKNHLFISNIGAALEVSAKDGDGYITMASREDGKVIEQKFITGLNAPKGLLATCRRLYVVDIDKVVGFDIKTKRKVFEADLSKYGVNYANDITRKCCGSFFVSATDKNAIFKICKNGKIKQLKIKEGVLEGVNGLYHKPLAARMYVANYGKNGSGGGYGRLCLASKKYKAYQTTGVYDGITRFCGGVIFSDWVKQEENRGRLVVDKPCGKKMCEVKFGRTIDGPADIYYDCHTRLVWVPAMRENKIIGVPIETIRASRK